MSKGVIYVATGGKYIDEAKKSARSVANKLGAKIVLYTDSPSNINDPIFDETKKISNPIYRSGDKIKCMKRSPFDETLFLDTDTYVCSDISQIFDLLDRYDLAAPYAPNRVNEEAIEDIPDTFPEINTGVVLFKKSKAFMEFVDVWAKRYKVHEKQGFTIDQASFRESLYYTDIRHHVLPPEYNMRFENVSVGYVSGDVKIMHGRRSHSTMKYFSEKVNSQDSNRVWVIEGDSISITNDMETISRRIKTNLSVKDVTSKVCRGVARYMQQRRT